MTQRLEPALPQRPSVIVTKPRLPKRLAGIVGSALPTRMLALPRLVTDAPPTAAIGSAEGVFCKRGYEWVSHLQYLTTPSSRRLAVLMLRLHDRVGATLAVTDA